ncbi:rCG60924, isoform CRA_a [Rattus norvegicus]|uniref:RCG60924, isoform CRA_a n=1 Tax=Rattus norvegicus TaxID=10116 RepID=A6JKA6_RAT|nr:rCG60924, isoform CRA_a [Rattus norvegicus]EDL97123.1 rCG60924, isoform CRA_a [Rattus norvegicus]
MRKDSAGGKEAYEKLSIFIRGGKKNQIQMLMVAQPSHGSGQKQNKTKQHKKKKQKNTDRTGDVLCWHNLPGMQKAWVQAQLC